QACFHAPSCSASSCCN
ncbi:response regulator, partial [Vibrio parahaemolyticus V-223/04]